MTDTARTDAANLALLADNNGGAISAQDVRDSYVSLASRGSPSAKQYGAVGDNSTDDTAAIQAAIDAAAVQTYGGAVFLPPGRYIVTGLQMKSRVTLFGAGPSSILKLKASTNAPVIKLAHNQVMHTTLRDFWIDGNRSQQSGADCDGITYVNEEELTGDDTLYTAIGDPQHRIYNLGITQCLHYGMDLFCRETHIRDCLITHSERGIFLQGSDNWLASSSVNWVDDRGVLTSGGGQLITHTKVWYTGQSASHSTGDAFDINSNFCTLVGCSAQDTSRHGIRFGANGSIAVGMAFDGIGMQFPVRGVGFEHDDGTGSHVAAVAFDEADTSRCRCNGIVRNRHFPTQTLDHAVYMGGASQIDNYVDLTILDTDPREEMYVITNPNGGNVVRVNGRLPIEASVTAANLAAVGNAINTTGKHRGKLIWESTNSRLYMATGAAAADPWYLIADNTGAVTPA